MLVILLSLFACNGPGTGPDSTPDDTPAADYEPLDEAAVIAQLPDSIELGHGMGEASIDPDRADPVTALAWCAASLLDCVEQGNAWEACGTAVRACETDEPWNEDPCCPETCTAQLQTELDAGKPGPEAWLQVLGLDGGCMPGLESRGGEG